MEKMATVFPITRQVVKENYRTPLNICLEDVENMLIYDRHGASIPFRELYQERKSVIIFVRNFLCYICKEYIDDLSKISREALKEAGITLVVIGHSAHHHIESFCSLTGYPYEMYVDPDRCIYKTFGMKKEEAFTDSVSPSQHVKSGVLMGHVKSMWGAMTSPAFDFQGDPRQQGGALIAGPGSKVHFFHQDMNRQDHMPIDLLLQLAGVQQTLDFSSKQQIVHV